MQSAAIEGSLTAQILNLIPGAGEKSSSVRQLTQRKIDGYLKKNLPIEVVLPAFPAKSPNRQKTLGPMPDLGEVLALQSIQKICEKIAEIYKPGAKVVICSDGRVFSDLVCVSDTAVNAYSIGIKSIIDSFSLSRVKTFNLDEVFFEHTFNEMREELVNRFAAPLEQVRERALSNDADRSMFNGIHRFIFEDRVSMNLGKSRTQTREDAKQIAYKVIQRSNAWSSLVEKHFPEALRLSIHPQHPETAKLPIRLLPSENAWRTPWHGVVLKEGENFKLTTHSQAKASGAKFQELQGRWGYFEQGKA